MRTIWKYTLDTIDKQAIKIPRLAGYSFKEQVLRIDTQREIPCMWVLVDDEEKLIERYISIIGTGHYCGEELDDYLGTYQLLNGALVWHIFGY